MTAPADATRILREIKLLRLLRHPDIVEIKHIMLPPSARDFKDIYVVFELMETDLHQVGGCWGQGCRIVGVLGASCRGAGVAGVAGGMWALGAPCAWRSISLPPPDAAPLRPAALRPLCARSSRPTTT